ncbi:MAG: ATP-binding protein [Cyanobacteriota bacterium]|nr:ATP-binding protein [Cyanobacteriota bacterium]
MNRPSPSTLSLYQLARGDLSRSPAIGRAALQGLVAASIDLLLDRGEIATLWLKLAAGDRCWSEIERYRAQAREWGEIYVLDSESIALPLPATAHRLKLRGEIDWQREWLFLAKSARTCIAIAAQQIEQSERYRVICSYDSSVFARALGGIQSAIASSPVFPENPAETPSVLPVDPGHLTHILLARLEAPQLSVSSPESHEQFVSQGLQELSGTLTRIKTALSLLRSPSLKPAQRQRYLEMLQRECDRQHSLICGMQNLVELDTPPGTSEPLTLEGIVPSIISIYQPLAQEKEIQLSYTLPAQLPPIACHSNRLQHILVHLLDNSLKYTPPNGKVTVQASRKGEYIEIVFRDTGVGIEPHELTKIFDCFYRGSINAGENCISAGLGLTSVQKLLLWCGGSISVASQRDRGTTFTVLLPVAESYL